MKVEASPLDAPCERPVTYEEDILNYSRNPHKEETDQYSHISEGHFTKITGILPCLFIV
jgi:hypothetical protein